MTGRFISIEGIEGAGKSTQVQLLVTALLDAGVDTLKTREPGGSPNAEALRGVFLDRGWDGIAESFLLMAGRRDHVVNRIRPMLDIGVWVVSDRFSLTTLAYQGHGRGVNMGLLRDMNHFATDGLMPDLTIILDLPVTVGLERVKGRGAMDRMENLGVNFFEKVREGLLELEKFNSSPCPVIDASRSSATVHASIVQAVNERFEMTLEATCTHLS